MVADEVIDVVTMRDLLMAALRAVNVIGLVPPAVVVSGTGRGIRPRFGNHVLIHMIVMDMMEVAIVQVIDMPFVLHRRVAAAGTVLMRVTLMRTARRDHDEFSGRE